MDELATCPRPLLRRDAAALIGLLAIVEGHLLAGTLGAGPSDHLRRRFGEVGLLPEFASEHDLHVALDDLNQRVRYALGE